MTTCSPHHIILKGGPRRRRSSSAASALDDAGERWGGCVGHGTTDANMAATGSARTRRTARLRQSNENQPLHSYARHGTIRCPAQAQRQLVADGSEIADAGDRFVHSSRDKDDLQKGRVMTNSVR